MKKHIMGIAAVAALTLLASGCAASDPLNSGGGEQTSGKGDTIVVGSANFPGNVLIGEVYAKALEDAGFNVERKLNIGAREVLYSQVENCSINVVPEYNQALLAFVDADNTAEGTEAVDAALAEVLPDSLKVLKSSAAQDNNAVAVTNATAEKHNLKSIADLKDVAPDMIFGGPTEWKERSVGYLGLQSKYGVEFKEYKILDYSGPITISALDKGDVDAALLFSTVPQIATSGYTVLEDPENAVGVNNVTPLVCPSAVPDDAQQVLDKVSEKLTTDDLIDMNASFSLDHEDAADVAAAWVKKAGL